MLLFMKTWNVRNKIVEPRLWNIISIIRWNNRWNRNVNYHKSGVHNSVSRIDTNPITMSRKHITCSSFVLLVNLSEIHNCYNYNCYYYSIIMTRSNCKDINETYVYSSKHRNQYYLDDVFCIEWRFVVHIVPTKKYYRRWTTISKRNIDRR